MQKINFCCLFQLHTVISFYSITMTFYFVHISKQYFKFFTFTNVGAIDLCFKYYSNINYCDFYTKLETCRNWPLTPFAYKVSQYFM